MKSDLQKSLCSWLPILWRGVNLFDSWVGNTLFYPSLQNLIDLWRKQTQKFRLCKNRELLIWILVSKSTQLIQVSDLLLEVLVQFNLEKNLLSSDKIVPLIWLNFDTTPFQKEKSRKL